MNSAGERSLRNRNEGLVADQHKPQSGVGVWPGVDVRLELEFGSGANSGLLSRNRQRWRYRRVRFGLATVARAGTSN